MSKKTTAQKLKSIRTYKTQEKLLMEWKDNWYKDQYKTIYLLRQAAQNDDHNTIMYAIDMLQGMTEKRFGTLENMIHIINNRETELIGDNNPSADTDVVSDKIEPKHISSGKEINNKKKEIKEFDMDEIAKFYRGGMSVKDLSLDYGVSVEKMIKLLVTYGAYSSDLYDRIKDMRLSGKSNKEIMNIIGLSEKSFNRYVPYSKGIYGLKTPSDNAIRIRKSRNKSLTDDDSYDKL